MRQAAIRIDYDTALKDGGKRLADALNSVLNGAKLPGRFIVTTEIQDRSLVICHEQEEFPGEEKLRRERLKAHAKVSGPGDT
jgi:hypothetical protein